MKRPRKSASVKQWIAFATWLERFATNAAPNVTRLAKHEKLGPVNPGKQPARVARPNEDADKEAWIAYADFRQQFSTAAH